MTDNKMVIFTDLDGTLLDAETYSYEKASPALDLINERGIPLVLCSSKTRAEIEVWRQRLGNGHPFISENGGGIFIPTGYFPFSIDGELIGDYRCIVLGMSYAEIRNRFSLLRERLRLPVKGFGDLTVDEVVRLTGLPHGEAVLAKQRDFEEPFIFPGAPDERFLREIEGEKLRWTQGRFFHLMGDHHKGRAVNILRRLYERSGGPVLTIGIGDSLNDLPFLFAVDRPVLVKKESGRHDARINIPNLVRTEGIGPAGWNEAVLELLK
ncbi:MAG: HAD-IIB family hydrolase [Nitrospirae bacterium]|nr:HAD-IIB family hydrolase [Nitrospirota bacterium]NTW65702.1 HAD-IIB family hydrolase [Nitrospirota bacterium]